MIDIFSQVSFGFVIGDSIFIPFDWISDMNCFIVDGVNSVEFIDDIGFDEELKLSSLDKNFGVDIGSSIFGVNNIFWVSSHS